MRIFIFVLLLTGFAQSQRSDFTKLYKDYLPAKYAASEEFKTNFSTNLDKAARVNPELIFWYLDFFTSRWSGNQTKIDSARWNRYNFHLAYLQKKRAEWAASIMESVSVLTDNRLKKREVLRYIDNFLEQPVEVKSVVQSATADSNKILYMAWVYLADEQGTVYDAKIDYRQLYIGRMKEKIVDFGSKLKHFSNITENEQEKLINEMTCHWYLFDKTYLQRYNLKNDVSPVDIFWDLVKSHYKERIIWSAGIVLDLLPYSKEYEIPLRIGNGLAFSEGVISKINVFSLCNASINARIPLADEKTFFSHIDADLQLGVGLAFHNPSLGDPIKTIDGVRTGERVHMVYSKKAESSFYGRLALTLSSPVYYYMQKMEAGLGVSAALNQYKLNLNIQNTETSQSSLGTSTTQFKYPFEFSGTFWEVGPIIYMKYSLDNMELSGCVKYPLHCETGLRYLLN